LKVIIIINGSGLIISKDAEPVDFAKGQTILLPAQFQGDMEFTDKTECLLTIL
jgi:hypothetical protein